MYGLNVRRELSATTMRPAVVFTWPHTLVVSGYSISLQQLYVHVSEHNTHLSVCARAYTTAPGFKSQQVKSINNYLEFTSSNSQINNTI